MSCISEDLWKINKRLVYDLWHMQSSNNFRSNISPKLIFPVKDDKDRISEQEPRVLYGNILNNYSNYYFSIETPTEQKYKQKGKIFTRARTDLTIYKAEGKQFDKIVNIEFKAEGEEENIKKDIEKLIKEKTIGNWVHIIRNINANTLSKLFEKFISSFMDFSDIIKDAELSILFCFCIVDKKTALLKQFYYNTVRNNVNLDMYLKEFFKIDYHIKSYGIIFDNKNNWDIIQETVDKLEPVVKTNGFKDMAEKIWQESPDFTIVQGTIGCSARHCNGPRLLFFPDKFCIAPKGKGNRLYEDIRKVLLKYFTNITGKAGVKWSSPDFSEEKFKKFVAEVKDICKKDKGMES